MCAQMMMFAIAHRAVADIVSESALKVDSGRKIPYHARDLNLHQYCAYLTHMDTGECAQSNTHTQTHVHTHAHTHTEEEITGLNAILPLQSSPPPPSLTPCRQTYRRCCGRLAACGPDGRGPDQRWAGPSCFPLSCQQNVFVSNITLCQRK